MLQYPGRPHLSPAGGAGIGTVSSFCKEPGCRGFKGPSPSTTLDKDVILMFFLFAARGVAAVKRLYLTQERFVKPRFLFRLHKKGAALMYF